MNNASIVSVMLITLGLLPAHAVAQAKSEAAKQPTDSAQQTVAEAEPMTVTGTARATDLFTAPADVDVLDGKEKQKRQTPSLGGSLESLPGVSNISAGSQIGKPVIRGLSGNRVRIMQNGIGVFHQQFGTRHGPNIEPFFADRIEVVRGASSILYGSDAIGGAVNVISTPVPFAAPGETQLGGEASAGYRSNNNERFGGLRLNAANWQFGVTGAFLGRDANNITTADVATFAESGKRPGAPKFSDELDNTDFEQLNGELAGGWLAPFGKVTARYKHWESEHNFLLPNGKGLGQNLENDLFQTEAEIALQPGWSVEPSFTWSNNLRQANPGGKTREFLPEEIVLDVERDSYTGRIELVHEDLDNWLSGRWGVEVVREEQVSRGSGTPLTPGGTISNYSVFGFEEFDLDALKIDIGLRFDHRDQEANPGDTRITSGLEDDSGMLLDPALLENTYDVVTGSIGASYRLMDNLVAAANVGRAYRAPDLFELYADGVHGGVAAVQKGDPSLDEEKSLNTDFSLRWRSDRLRAQATVYRNQINDYIFLFSTGGSQGGKPIFQYDQNDATLYGTNLSARFQVNRLLALHGSFELVRGEFDDSNDDLPLLPADELRGGFTLTPPTIGVLHQPYLTLEVVYNSDKDAAGNREPFSQFDRLDVGTASTDDYTLVNLLAGFDLPYQANGRPGRINVQVNNLFDEDYRDFLDTYKGYALSPGRNVTVQMNLPF